MNLEELVHDIARKARDASEKTAELSSDQKDAWLLRAAERLEGARDKVRDANEQDMREAEQKGVAGPLV